MEFLDGTWSTNTVRIYRRTRFNFCIQYSIRISFSCFSVKMYCTVFRKSTANGYEPRFTKTDTNSHNTLCNYRDSQEIKTRDSSVTESNTVQYSIVNQFLQFFVQCKRFEGILLYGTVTDSLDIDTCRKTAITS